MTIKEIKLTFRKRNYVQRQSIFVMIYSVSYLLLVTYIVPCKTAKLATTKKCGMLCIIALLSCCCFSMTAVRFSILQLLHLRNCYTHSPTHAWLIQETICLRNVQNRRPCTQAETCNRQLSAIKFAQQHIVGLKRLRPHPAALVVCSETDTVPSTSPHVCLQITASATVASASVTPAGRATTATAPHAPTCACPASACSAADAATASAACATARSRAPTEPLVRSVPPAPTPAPLRSRYPTRGWWMILRCP